MKLLRNKRGDTIVEVMIAMAIATAVLGAAYGSVNRTLAGVQLAQERSEALQIATTQIEYIKDAAATAPATVFDKSPRFRCISEAGAVAEMPTLTAVPGTDDARYVDDCRGRGVGEYRIAFELIGTTTDGYFKVTVAWFDQRGFDNNVTLSYKAYRND